jgi:hypothetical protein
VDFLRILRIRVAKNGCGRASVPASAPETARRITRNPVADDIIAADSDHRHIPRGVTLNRLCLRPSGAINSIPSGDRRLSSARPTLRARDLIERGSAARKRAGARTPGDLQ